ncbi:MAG TPA: hypothetical protein VFZ70_18275 [Euzebyales bacterium]
MVIHNPPPSDQQAIGVIAGPSLTRYAIRQRVARASRVWEAAIPGYVPSAPTTHAPDDAGLDTGAGYGGRRAVTAVAAV